MLTHKFFRGNNSLDLFKNIVKNIQSKCDVRQLAFRTHFSSTYTLGDFFQKKVEISSLTQLSVTNQGPNNSKIIIDSSHKKSNKSRCTLS